MYSSSTLFHKGKGGALYQWRVWTEGNQIFTEYGQVGGKLQITPGKKATGKNIGKKNATTDEQQAEIEALAMYTFKIERKYSLTPEETEEPSYLPMLAAKYKEKFKKVVFPVDVQRKLNGVRCLASRLDGKIRLMSRGGKTWNVPHIEAELEAWLPDDAVVDGEIYVHGESLQTIASWVKRLQPNTQKLEYHIYDVPEWGGKEPDRPWSDRRKDLEEVRTIFAASTCVFAEETFTAQSDDEVQKLFREFLADAYEGAMVRLHDGPYIYDYRSSDLLKIKEFTDAEFKIVDFKDGDGKFEKCVIWWCEMPDDPSKRFKAVPKGSMEFRKKMYAEGASHIGEMLTVRYIELTPDGLPFHAVGIAIRLPEDMDQPKKKATKKTAAVAGLEFE